MLEQGKQSTNFTKRQHKNANIRNSWNNGRRKRAFYTSKRSQVLDLVRKNFINSSKLMNQLSWSLISINRDKTKQIFIKKFLF